ncbi:MULTISPECIES: hydroxymethylbilane synthase [Flavobacterium]|uniref:Hydroxymethylbilane synthase n=1 Tax=Flavobacterium columnare TaxID=996 RepID=A0AA94EXD9_9FLAO|nr:MULTISPECIES: hydroxymethylbilane synthase [Flavobacterium]OXA78135.1 hydroxymethylbilane synthase [Flavobacterium columnare NBRC 100251 = ATCC 23463]AMA50368.1 porphobilinogen deaminase [Flavobacterium covae]AND64090.1 hydroxymethylbilane synthase [Flavobacterium covae]MCH4829618.1 hydroxymethylbilane synthase [Flavobacterium columnare]MCH4831385.1 hydroxymethylbilane synthase [Flavobacterium columnare]
MKKNKDKQIISPGDNNRVIRIGTRDSELALWQAHTVEKQLNDLGYKTKIIAVKSQGDIILDKPLYELGITGIFTKTLDIAMISGQVDIAVHSMKDVPTTLPQGIVQAAVLERANTVDILVHKGSTDFLNTVSIIATGSLRRQAQWLHKYPQHKTVDLRGNVNTRLQKLKDNDWGGAIFACAGLERLNLKPETTLSLDWMIPAPAQGAMMVVAMAEDTLALEALSELNHIETEICTYIERQFLRTLEGGCTAPIGALATYNEETDQIDFKGALFSINGQQKITIERSFDVSEWKKLGLNCAREILNNGGNELMIDIKKQLKK